MSDSARIPKSIEGFHGYINTTNTYLVAGAPTTNSVRLGILPAEQTQWTASCTSWNLLYPKYLDKRNSRTPAVTEGLYGIIEKFHELNKTYHLLDRIAASPNVTVNDLAVLNINSGMLMKSSRSVMQTAITEPILATVTPIGGGVVTIKCRSLSSQRACIFTDADCVQFTYIVGTEPPASANDRNLFKEISTRAGFTLSTGAENSAKYLYIYFRWYNTRHAELAGPWSQLQTILIL